MSIEKLSEIKHIIALIVIIMLTMLGTAPM